MGYALDGVPACFQISCYQTGFVGSTLPDFVLDNLREGAQVLPPDIGYVAARLREAIDVASVVPMTDLPVLTLIAQSFLGCDSRYPAVCIPLLGDGDGLITYQGQRFKHDPSTNRPPLLVEARTTSGLIVTERILGFRPGADTPHTDPVSIVPGLSPYAVSLTTGYWHTAFFTQITAGTGMQEVAVPSGLREECNSPCENDTWVNIRDFLRSQHGGPVSENFLTTTGPQAVVVSAVTFAPNPAVVGAPVAISVSGANLPADIAVNLNGCTGLTAVSGGTTNLRQFTCTPTQPGTQSTELKLTPCTRMTDEA